jgi:hypothetical protein
MAYKLFLHEWSYQMRNKIVLLIAKLLGVKIKIREKLNGAKG